LPATRAAKWATVQVGTGRTVSEVAGELNCDWPTVNDAVTTNGAALLAADRTEGLNSLIKTDQADQTDRVRLPQLRQLPHPRPALRRQAELARPRLHRRPVTTRSDPSDSEEPD
jgi:hypothetical protein